MTDARESGYGASSSSVTTQPRIVVGVDTVSILWRHDLPPAVTNLLVKGTLPVVLDGREFRPTNAQSLIHVDRENDLRYFLRAGKDRGRAGASSLWVEGRAARTPGELGSLDAVIALVERATRAWRDMGVDPFGVMSPLLRRLDLAADIHADPAVGGSVLDALARMPLDRGTRQQAWRESFAVGERFSGVDLLHGAGKSKRVELRAYCKLTEQAQRGNGTRPEAPGAWLRIERQLRFDPRPRLVDVLHPERLAVMWSEPLAGMLAPSVSVAQAMRLIVAAQQNGTVDVATTKRLAGHVTMQHIDRRMKASASTEARAVAQLAALGISRVDDAPMPAATRELLAEAIEAWQHIAPASLDLTAFDVDDDVLLI